MIYTISFRFEKRSEKGFEVGNRSEMNSSNGTANMEFYPRAICFLIYVLSLFFVTTASGSLCPDFPKCDCRQNADKYDIYCMNVNNLTEIQELLHTNFSGKEVNKLIFVECSVTVLPNNVFDNFSITALLTSCPFSEIEEDALRNIPGLKKVQLKNTTFKFLPSGLRNMTNLKTLSVWFNKLEELSDEFVMYYSLSFLSIREGCISRMLKDVFVPTPNILYLDFSYNKLELLHHDTFDPLQILQRVVLRGNQLLTVDGLLKKLNPELVDFYDNRIISVENAFHLDMWQLKSLNLGKNRMSYINASAFLGKTENLVEIDLSATGYEILDPNLLQSLQLLKKVNLARNDIVRLPEGFFRSMLSLQLVDLSSNDIISISGQFDNNPQLEILILTANYITNISNALSNLPKLQKLYLSGNNIEEIRFRDFESTPAITILDLSYNNIVNIDRDSFIHHNQLQKLDLSSNPPLTTLNYSVRFLLSLEDFQCKSSNLVYIRDDELTELPKLTSVNLVYNRLRSVNGAFGRLLSLKSLNLAKNKLSSLSRDTFPKIIKLKELWMAAGNPWVCDCRLLWLLEWLISKNGSVLKDEPLCHEPERLHGKPFRNLTENELIEWPDRCPYPCNCSCVPQNRTFYVKADCAFRGLSSIPETLPFHLGDLEMNGNELTNITLNNSSYLSRLQILNLTNNSLTSFHAISLPKPLKVLTLNENRLHRIPVELFANHAFENMKLSGNPWICDCETVAFRKWLLKVGHVVSDANETVCGYIEQNDEQLQGKAITSLKDTDLCPSRIQFYVAVAMGVLGLLLVVTTLTLGYFRYNLHIKVWLYSHGFTWVKEEDLDTNKLFDAYLSYSPHDEHFALGTIVPGLEQGDPSFWLCIAERNIMPGGIEIADKLKALTECKRIIVILSQNYVEDESCMEIFRIAFSLSLEDKVNRIIVIEYGDLNKDTEIEPALKAVLESTRSIVWGEKSFWPRVRYNMPKYPCSRKRLQVQQTEPEDDTVCDDNPNQALI